MAQMKNFESAARERDDDERIPISFEINGEGWGRDKEHKFEGLSPTKGQVALFMAAVGSGEYAAGLAAIMELLKHSLNHGSFTALRSRIADEDDPLEMDDMSDIVAYLIELVTARPTQPRSDSSGTRRSTGSSSTPASRRRV
jgi:hypothetical protein